jgi:biopolymer transport protein ExbD
VFWNREYLKDSKELFERLKKVAVVVPQPEVHIRADENARYESVGKVVATAQRASILKIGFITEPPARSLAGG